MKRLKLRSQKIIGLVLLVSLPAIATTQPGKYPFHREAYFLDTGRHNGLPDSAATSSPVFSGLISIPGAAWLRLHFGDNHLDSLSYILITSLNDGARQRLDAVSLKQWRGNSAFFNGDGLELELYAAPGDSGVFLELHEVLVGERVRVSTLGKVMDLCGADDRDTSSYAAVGRLIYEELGDTIAFATGWIAANGVHISAGHCLFVERDTYVLEFNVPLSNSSGQARFAHPNDQYPINWASVEEKHAPMPGDDWALFECEPNSNTGLLPVQAQQAFYRVKLGTPSGDTRLTGYGEDSNPPEWNKTQQTSTGDFVREQQEGCSYCITLDYVVDEENGCSGGPVTDTYDGLAIGLHHDGFCLKSRAANIGTSFKNDSLEKALNDYPGTNVTYLDKDHPVLSQDEDGTIYRPFDTVQEAVNDVGAGGIVSIVKGYYNETPTITKAMTITAPVGMVTIGASGMGKVRGEIPMVAVSTSTDADSANSLAPIEYALSPNYPTPFN
ncbi:MAG: hypothetical protein JSW54_02935, partial [Fidelibacterota bacterium]